MKLKKYKLGELIDVTRGQSLSGEYYATEGKYIRLTCGNFDYNNNSFKENTSKDNLFFTGTIKPEFIMKKGDIITPLTEQAIGLLGSTAIIPESDKYIQSQDVAKIICKENKLDHDFAYYLISSKLVKEQLSVAAQQTKIRHTSPDKIKDCTVWIPDIEAQRRIASVLSTLDRKISLNRSINLELERMAKEIYDYWFVQFEFPRSVSGESGLPELSRTDDGNGQSHFPDEHGRPYKSSGGAMVYNPVLKREVPQGWEVKQCKDLVNIVTGKEDANFSSPCGRYPFFTCSKDVLKCDIPAFNGSSVLIAGNGDFNVKHYTGKFNAYQRTYVLTPPQKYYGALFFAAFERIESFKSKSNGSIIKFITKGDIESLYVFDCKDDCVYNTINNLIYQIEKNTIQIEELAKIQNELLPILMTGQVTIE